MRILRKLARFGLVMLVLRGLILVGGAAELPVGFVETRVAAGLNPTTMRFAPDGRLFLCEKQGLLRLVVDGRMREESSLDISARVDAWNERGLLSVCFDPEFAENGWLYVYYTHNRDPSDVGHESSNNRVSRFTLKGDVVDPSSEVVVWELDDLSKVGWHNGGGLEFGGDGKLYISTGENSVAPKAQSGENLLGKLLRIEKDGSIPTDNPNYEKYSGKNRAIVALGLRNPFAIARQADSGLLYLCVVGAKYEQIMRYDSSGTPRAVNYGWPQIDGPLQKEAPPESYRAPVYAYDHGEGQGLALCGGDFYNPAKPGPQAFPARFRGKFFFADYGGWIKLIDPEKPEVREDFATGIDRPIDVATAPDGALWYIERAGIPGGSNEANSASGNGSLWRVHWTGEVTSVKEKSSAYQVPNMRGKLPLEASAGLPVTLSLAEIFVDENLTPATGFVPYSLNSAVWADGSEVEHWVGLPEGARIGFAPEGEYTWPGGTVFAQHFELVMNEVTGERRRLETRLLVLDQSGNFGYGASYRWRADGSDADLVNAIGEEEVLDVVDASGERRPQKWTYPGRGLCYLCHTVNAGFALGPKTHQLNGSHKYPDGGLANQLKHWSDLQMFDTTLSDAAIEAFGKSYRIDDSAAPLEDRVRSYLDANCASCHRPAGSGSQWDARFEIPLEKQGIVDGMVRNTLGVEGGRILVPGDVGKSILHVRMASTSMVEQMPPVARNLVDEEALEVIVEWIRNSAEKP